MSLPRLVLATQDTREIARVLRGALRLRTEVVRLFDPPTTTGQHLLEVDVPGVGTVSVLAEPKGSPRPEGVPLAVRPVTRVQMAELFALVERLDEPSQSEPPPPDDDPPPESDGLPDDTMNDASSKMILPNSEVGLLDSVRPASIAPAQANADPRIGRLLAGKYVIDTAIGRGAAATVYRATHKDLRRAVAVKILNAENQSDKQFIRRFRAEALTASKLEHANVTRIIDFGQTTEGELYLVMELVRGKTVEALLATGGPMTPKRTVDVGVQVCRALVFAHEQGVIHRDIKPENIMLVPDTDDDGEPCDLVKVCDFGLAKLRGPREDDSILTVTGMLCGSPAYMSPEQTRGDPLDARVDIYALGVTLFEMLTGALPYDAHSIEELFLKKCSVVPKRASDLVAIDQALDALLAKAMAIDPGARQASARELRADLRAARPRLDR